MNPDTPQAPSAAPVPRGVELRALLLIVLMALLLLGSALYLMWARGAFEATQPLYLVTDDSEGVIVGMDMSFSGFPIGRVRQIELARGGVVRIQVDVPTREAHWLRSTSVFTLERGLVGAARLKAFSGVPDDPPLPAGAEREVLRGDATSEIPRLISDARDVLQNVNRLTAADSALSQGLAELGRFVQRLNGNKGGLMTALTGNEADARRVAELLDRTGRLLARLDALAASADRRVLGDAGLVADAQVAVRQLDALLKDVRQSVVRVDAVLTEAQGVASNARGATEGLGDLRADVEASLARIDALIAELARKWPFAPAEKEVRLP